MAASSSPQVSSDRETYEVRHIPIIQNPVITPVASEPYFPLEHLGTSSAQEWASGPNAGRAEPPLRHRYDVLFTDQLGALLAIEVKALPAAKREAVVDGLRDRQGREQVKRYLALLTRGASQLDQGGEERRAGSVPAGRRKPKDQRQASTELR